MSAPLKGPLETGGKLYRTRNGEQRGPMLATESDLTPFQCSRTKARYTSAGNYWVSACPDDRDIVAEWTDAPDAEQAWDADVTPEGVAQMTALHGVDPDDGWDEWRHGMAIPHEDDLQLQRVDGEWMHRFRKPITSVVTIYYGLDGFQSTRTDESMFAITFTEKMTPRGDEVPDCASLKMERLK